MMPSFHGSAIEAGQAGYSVKPCVYCQNWVWVAPNRKAKRVWCPRQECERAEGLACAAENPRPTYHFIGRMGADLGTFAIDEFDASWSTEDLEQVRSLGWLEKVRFDSRNLLVLRVT
jgi:hypothetical protein